ncbi:hypothetical protein PR202_gb07881 [Eleusine coracana subsp. coracana]|uniref:GDSL esterase/lipase n=1 Tax=Eleusine coracana subsp. coracana TaxID=191504 RepID=A0AAV5EDF3_ELECO|nr:hypothetical protein PR202_gb07881 [Eleusine coracana subsp. coracana]
MFPRLLIVELAVAIVIGHAAGGGHGLLAHYDRVFSFGNSLTDTGNGAILPATAGGPSTRPPYGETYFHHPSGRASDGRLIIDFIGTDRMVPDRFLDRYCYYRIL